MRQMLNIHEEFALLFPYISALLDGDPGDARRRPVDPPGPRGEVEGGRGRVRVRDEQPVRRRRGHGQARRAR